MLSGDKGIRTFIILFTGIIVKCLHLLNCKNARISDFSLYYNLYSLYFFLLLSLEGTTILYQSNSSNELVQGNKNVHPSFPSSSDYHVHLISQSDLVLYLNLGIHVSANRMQVLILVLGKLYEG